MIKPRFLFVLPSLRAGGAEKVVIRIANDLVSHGEVVALAVVDCVGELRGDLDQNIVVHDLGIQKTRYAFFALVRLIRRLSPELIFSSLTRVSLLLLMARPLLPRSTRIVVRQPGIASIDLKHLEPRWLYQLLFVRLMPRADLIVTQSGPMTTDLASILATRVGRVVEIPNPSPTVDRRSYLDAGTPFSGATNFLAVGRLSSEKGYDTLLAAFSIVAARRDDARLTIIGDARWQQNCRTSAPGWESPPKYRFSASWPTRFPITCTQMPSSLRLDGRGFRMSSSRPSPRVPRW